MPNLESAIKDAAELINFDPKAKRQQVIQLYIADQPLLICQGYKGETRENMLAAILTLKGIPFDIEIRKYDEKHFFTSPSLVDTRGRYRVTGMGNLSLDPDKRLYRGIHKKSKKYEMGPDREHERHVDLAFKRMKWRLYKLFRDVPAQE